MTNVVGTRRRATDKLFQQVESGTWLNYLVHYNNTALRYTVYGNGTSSIHAIESLQIPFEVNPVPSYSIMAHRSMIIFGGS